MNVSRRMSPRIALGLLGTFVAIQLVPYGRAHTNSPVTGEPPWDTPATRALAKQACFDCHSNETEWPWYSKVAPSSWLLAYDVAAGRSRMNFSEWDTRPTGVGEIIEQVSSGEMPPVQYTLAHPETKLEGAQLDAFIAALKKTFR